jgi:hypothetical protein
VTRCRRLSLLSFAVLVAACALAVAFAGPASASGSKVLLVTRNEEGEGPPAVTGEPAHITGFFVWPALGVDCGAVDENAVVGKNPAGTVKVRGSDVLLPGFCFAPGETPTGDATIKSVTVSRTGAVMLHGALQVVAAGCHYRATKLTGTQTFGEQFAETLTGTAKLVRKGSSTSCATTTPVEDSIGVADAAGFNYLVKLTS